MTTAAAGLSAPPDPKKDRSRKPPTLAPRPDDIPLVLTALPQWICWRWDWNMTRNYWTKVPLQAIGSRFASTTDPNTWATFDAAVSGLERDEVDGIGFVFTASDPFCGIDLDKCRDPETGTISDEAQDVLVALDGYAELSVTGTGVHVIVRASMGDIGGKKSSFIEVYDRARYFTMTGHRLPTREAAR